MNALNNISCINISKICRICLLESGNMRSIFSKLDQTEILEINVAYISDVLIRITSVPINEADGFPQLVCLNCMSLIHAAYKFKIQFDNSYSLLQQYVTNCVKEEITQDLFNLETNVNSQLDCNAANQVLICTKNQNCSAVKETKTEIQVEKRSRKENNFRISRRTRKYKQQEIIQEDKFSEFLDEEKAEETVRTHPCPICTKEFSAAELRQHAQTHKALKKYLNIPLDQKVNMGMQFYVDSSSSPRHVSIHKRKEKLHKCVMCNEEFNAIDLRVHLDTHRNQKEYHCDQCERVFRKMNHLNTHRVKHLKEFPFKCEQCGKGFVIKTNYECHMLTHNENQELPYECSQCLRRFYNPEHLNRHMVLHTENVSYSVKYKVCKCYHCLKTFKDRDELKLHQCVPVEQAVNVRYPCKDCKKVFKNSAALYNHTRNIHKLNGAKILCSVCGVHVSNIYNHMMRHTGEKPYQCTQCGKRFIGKPQLKQHLLVHSGLKPFVCSVCAKAFNNFYNLQVHERIHKGDKCHICSICNKGFLEKSYLKKHMNVHAKL